MFEPFEVFAGFKEEEDQRDIEELTLPKLKLEHLEKEPLPKEVRNAGLDIVPFKTKKDKVRKDQRPLMKNGTIPTHPSSVIFNGRSGSGKSNLIVNLLTRPEFYGRDKRGDHYFDEIHMFSPTAGEMDDLPAHLQKHTPLKEKNIHNSFDEAMLLGILDKQSALIKAKGDISKAPKVLVLLDDIQADKKFLRSETIIRIFIANRHYNTSVWLAGQSFNLTPRPCRLQANNLFIFPMSGSELEVLRKEFTPAGMKSKDFVELIRYATSELYQFLHINMREPPKTRFRKNLKHVLELKDF